MIPLLKMATMYFKCIKTCILICCPAGWLTNFLSDILLEKIFNHNLSLSMQERGVMLVAAAA